MRPNPGSQPRETRGKRVHVVLADGYDTRRREPEGWAADTTNWSRAIGAHSIAEYEVIR